ncbi:MULTISPECIES: response regulator transcription factor [unclassified Cupriavidus]|jgi:DNA-binding NarL/FixJ family response regulator|uniref:response regulator transcription factor n=1 Tax=unclassified Cupriavidus TaxID=2640874 RepID=UPI001C004E41|nr:MULTISPECIES: response regulator transcription factor [unclassified Cupriavidus]MCA3183985.1 response regulator transcription factor [Cupriavidus sp.]MCA3191803.1 response regulator transcription factor [Cupriavidus sp.]MCA3198033.1 response regulator transcription factor [Cupriavidus sp.]MCA3200717.1 response regulator transcription factor [Cupriavidus sp.]MCA3207752.1 response regulator transcription factor [Cupriavidus sp.]
MSTLSDRSPRQILCIEDDAETATLIAEELTERGFRVSVAHNGQDGFAAVLRDPPDLVLCDVSMPVMDGFALLTRLRALAPRFADIPFVFLTALAQRDAELKGRRLGADDYVTKPVDFDILESILEARLARSGKILHRGLPHVVLSEREIETLSWSARGKTSAEIATILGLSKRTVDFHMDNARDKLGVATRVEAVVRAAREGLIDP